MALTRDFKETVQARARRDPAFRQALLQEAVTTMLDGDLKTGKAVLRDYINATIGFEELGRATGTPPKSLMRMFGPRGNPQASNLFAVLGHLQKQTRSQTGHELETGEWTRETIETVSGAQEAVTTHATALDALSKAARNPLADALRTIEENPAVRQMLKDVERHEALRRAVEGPLAELRQAGVFDFASPIRREMERTQRTMAEFVARFRLPEISEAARLMAEFKASPLSDALQRYSEQTTSIQRAMEAMRTPWLDAEEAMRSIGGFAELQGMGRALSSMPTFDTRLVSALRVDLGDWRDRITWPETILTDLAARSEFYVGLGFDPALTDFPAPAFQQSLDLAGLRREPPPLMDQYSASVPPSEDGDEEEGLVRTNMAHNWLLRLETQLRRFIDDQMTRAFGANWPKHRLPNELYDKWQEKKTSAEKAGAREWPLIAYADFTDYERVICKKDNWREVFGSFFHRRESVLESFQRLYPVRLDAMHARPITQDDELLLRVETRRLVRVILL
jgi:DNA-binding phage protein